jgi:O-antigen ligase
VPVKQCCRNLSLEKKLPKLARISLPSLQFWGLLAPLAALFAMGGSSRPDVQSLALLNPLMIAFCGVALLFLRPEQFEGKKSLLAGFLIVILLVATYLLPMSGQIVRSSIGAGDVAEVRAAADLSGIARITLMAPATAWQSLFFLFAPLAVFLFALQLNRDDLRLSVLLLIAAGAISGIIGVLQLAGSAGGPLYFYQITNNGSAVGLFANRNHAAVFLACLFPMLALFAAKSEGASRGRNTPQLIIMAIAITLVPLILVTGSRSGMLTATVGLIGGALLYVSHAPSFRGSTKAKSVTQIWAAAILVCLVLVTVYFSRAEAIERIFAENGGANDRADFWTSSLQLFWQYFPFGFGPGGFVSTFQITEPLALLDGAILNRLHNDWLETALTFGVPGIFLMLAGVGYYLRRSFILWIRMDGARSAVALGRMASIVIAILGIASLSDYPLRTPAMAGFAALVLVWFAHARHEPTAG